MAASSVRTWLTPKGQCRSTHGPARRGRSVTVPRSHWGSLLPSCAVDIKVTLPPTPPPPPPPVRLRHSRSYLLKQQREAEGLAAEASFSGRDESSRSRKALVRSGQGGRARRAGPSGVATVCGPLARPQSENAISYLLQQVDDTLDEVEARPSKVTSRALARACVGRAMAACCPRPDEQHSAASHPAACVHVGSDLDLSSGEDDWPGGQDHRCRLR